MKNKTFLRHFMVIGFGTVVTMAISLLTTPIITRIVSPEEYGQLSIFNIYVSIAVMILCLGLDQGLVRYYYHSESRVDKSILLQKCLQIPSFLTLILVIVVIVADRTQRLNLEFSGSIIVFLGVQIYTQLIYRFIILTIRLDYKSNLYSALGIISKILYVVSVLVFIKIFKVDHFLSLIMATVASGSIALFIALINQKDLFKYLFKKKINTIGFNELVSYSWPFIISMGITQVFQATDKIILNHFCSYTDVGIYSSAMSLVNIFSVVQVTFNSLWAPMAVEHFQKDPNDKEFYRTGNQYITIIMFAIGFSLIFAKDIFVILLGEKFREAAYILPFLIFNPIMYTVSETTVSGISFMKKSKAHIAIGLISCITNIVVSIILVPYLGGKGAAISTGISYTVFFAMRTFFSNRYFYVDYKIKHYAVITCLAFVNAAYNTFFKFGIISIVLYIVSMSILLILYREYVIKGIGYLITFLKNNLICHKVQKHNQ